MNASKRNADRIRDALLEETGNPFTVNAVMAKIAQSDENFDKVQIIQGGKTTRTVVLDGAPKGVFKAVV